MPGSDLSGRAYRSEIDPAFGISMRSGGRAAVRDHFAKALTRNSVADLELVVSELVTNGVEHGQGSVQLAIEHNVNEINGSVTDDGKRI